MKKWLTIICSLLICLTASASYYKFDEAQIMGLIGSMRYGENMEVLFGGGKEVKTAQFVFFYSKERDIFSFNISTEGTILLDVVASFSDISLNIDPENNRIQGLKIKHNGDLYRIFKAEGPGAEIVSENAAQRYVLDPDAAGIYTLENMDTPLQAESNWADDRDADYYYNRWLEYIYTLVKK
ncbi:MAG: hypothetical protein J1E97_06200 [Muribaculaceae bacterium]|nr:hypothetical protein [Muribaculaceae bacterium]